MAGLSCSGCGFASSGHLEFDSPAELYQCQECWVTSCTVQVLGVTFLSQCWFFHVEFHVEFCLLWQLFHMDLLKYRLFSCTQLYCAGYFLALNCLDKWYAGGEIPVIQRWFANCLDQCACTGWLWLGLLWRYLWLLMEGSFLLRIT